MQKTLLLLFSTLLLIATSCTKYDDGGISFRAEKKLTDHSWILDTIITIGNTDSTIEHLTKSIDIEYVFNKNGDFIQTTTFDTTINIIKGTWELTNKNKTLSITTNSFNPINYSDSTQRLDVWDVNDSTVVPYSNWPNLFMPNTFTFDYNIIKLKDDELWFSFTINLPEFFNIENSTSEIHLKAKK